LRTKAAADPDFDATHRRIHAERCARFFTDPEGGRNLVVRGTGDRVARIEKALEPFVDELFKTAWAEGRQEPREAYVFDALVMLSERDQAPETRNRSPKPGFLTLVHVPFEALVRGAIEGRARSSASVRFRSVPPANSWGS